ncbi:MAG: FAD-binding protein, partial [Evtepia sp.]
MPNVIIIGSGPAGISAALYTARAGIPTMVISKGRGALSKADLIENYYGFAEPISAANL